LFWHNSQGVDKQLELMEHTAHHATARCAVTLLVIVC